MWTGGAAGLADRADERAALELLAGFHVDAAQMAVHRHQTLAVIDEHGVAIEEVIARRDHAARCRRAHRTARGRGNVEASVRIARQAVEDAPQPEWAAERAIGRQIELQGQVALIMKRSEGGIHLAADASWW